jgi:hypothetical protein
MEHWWNDTDRGKLQYLEKKLSQCQFVHHMCILDSQLLTSAGMERMFFTDIRLSLQLQEKTNSKYVTSVTAMQSTRPVLWLN